MAGNMHKRYLRRLEHTTDEGSVSSLQSIRNDCPSVDHSGNLWNNAEYTHTHERNPRCDMHILLKNLEKGLLVSDAKAFSKEKQNFTRENAQLKSLPNTTV
jgi:hypothetical protein